MTRQRHEPVIDKPGHARRLPEQSEWTFELIEQAHEEITPRRRRVRPRHLSEPA